MFANNISVVVVYFKSSDPVMKVMANILLLPLLIIGFLVFKILFFFFFHHYQVIFLSNDWTVVALHIAHKQFISSPPPFPNRCCREGFMRSLYELSINQKQSSLESVILPPILPSTVSLVHFKMKRSLHCVAPLALCKYYIFSLDMLVSITSTLWLHYF